MADIDSPIQHGNHERAKFRAMTEGTQEDWSLISSEYMAFARDLPDRVLAHLKLLDGDFGGFPPSLLSVTDQFEEHGFEFGPAGLHSLV